MNTTLNEILKDLYMISGCRICIYDTDLNEIASYPRELSSFCSFMQMNGNITPLCKENDRHAFAVVRETGAPYIYQCKFGLYEAVAPLYHFGTLSGYLMMGQTLDSFETSRKFTYDAAKNFVTDKSRLKEVIHELPTSTKDRIKSSISIMSICASYITLSNLMAADAGDLAEKVSKFMNQNYHMKITHELLCQRFFCSKATLTNAFKKSFGLTIHEYLLNIRLNKAKLLLKNDHLSINGISDSCGFTNQNYFTKVFKKEFGYTPSQYRSEPDIQREHRA